jgi:hypothetical protein
LRFAYVSKGRGVSAWSRAARNDRAAARVGASDGEEGSEAALLLLLLLLLLHVLSESSSSLPSSSPSSSPPPSSLSTSSNHCKKKNHYQRHTSYVTRHTSHVTCVLASLAAATTSQAFSDATSSACTCARCQTPKRPIFTVQETLSTHIIQRDLPVAALDDAAENPQSRPLCRALAQETK